MAIETRINKNGAKSYRARVKDPVGKFYPSVWSTLYDEALREEASQVSRKRIGEQAFTSLEGQKYTFNEFWPIFQFNNRTEMSEGWKISQDQMVRDFIAPVIGHLRLSKIGVLEITQVLNTMKARGLSPQMRKHVSRLMKKIFNVAMTFYRMIPENPVKPEFHGVKVPEIERNFLRPEQAWALLEASTDHPAIWLELLAGLRTEAALALTWDCIHWDTDQILICKAFKQKIRRIEAFPKGRKAEYVPMNPALKEYLRDRFERSGALNADFVCTGRAGNMLKPETLGGQLRRLCQKAGVPRVSPHELRHSCTELFVREGATQEDLRRLLNHKSGVTTLRYMHRTDDRLNSIAARIRRPDLYVVGGIKDAEITHGHYPEGKNRRMPAQEAAGK